MTKLAATKKIGIWMDHANANLMEFNTGRMDTVVIRSEFTHHEKQESLSKSENLMHHKEQHLQGKFFKEIGEVIKSYNSVLLFGPTDAKKQLLNLIHTDPHFAHIKFEIKSADKMTEYQQYTFVREHFADIL